MLKAKLTKKDIFKFEFEQKPHTDTDTLARLPSRDIFNQNNVEMDGWSFLIILFELEAKIKVSRTVFQINFKVVKRTSSKLINQG
jgi:hypothetical protein